MILITGVSGLLGANLLLLAQDKGLDAVGLYHRNAIDPAAAMRQAADLTDAVETARILQKLSPSYIVHCAAATDVDWCEAHPTEANRVNVAAAATIANFTSRTGAKLVYVSTDSVFDGEVGNYAETDTPAPVNVYAKTKLQGEREVLHRDPSAIIARVNLYGWNAQNKDSLAEWILKELGLGRSVPGFSDVIFCPMLVNDLAEILLEMLDRGLSGLYHLVGSDAVTKYEFAMRVASEFGYDATQVVPKRLSDSKLKAPRPRNTSLNTGKISQAMGRTMPDVDAGLRRFHELKERGYVDRLKGDLTGVRR
jgi:dTDP-4-dehydrorhamnose reductase